MKLLLFLLVIMSVALSVTAQLIGSTMDVHGLAPAAEPPAHAPGQVSEYATDDSDDEVTDPRTVDDYLAELTNLTSSDGTTANVSVSSTETAGDFPGKYAVALRMGPSQQHVGTLRKQRMWNAVYNCLKEINLTMGRGSNYRYEPCVFLDGPPEEWCGTWCKIPNIVYVDKGYHNKAYLLVRMWWPNLEQWNKNKNTKNDHALELMFRTVASIYKTMTEVDENCYTYDFPGSRRTKMCNVAKQVLVALPINGGTVQSVVKVDVRFNGRTEAGKWDCQKTLPRVIQDFRATRQAEIGQIHGWGENNIVPLAMCAPDECLDWWKPNPDGEWQENPDCKTLTGN